MSAKVLLVLSPQRRFKLQAILEGSGLDVFLASDCREAQRKLAGAAPYDLLLVDSELPDGSWRDLSRVILDSGRSCEMIICSRCGDERLWAEAIQCGAYDLLVEPYEEREVNRIVRNALEARYMQRFPRPMVARAS